MNFCRRSHIVHTEAVGKLARDAERLLRESDTCARTLYEDAFRSFVRVGLARERNGSPPQVVAQLVARADHTPAALPLPGRQGLPADGPRCRPARPPARRPAPQDRPPASSKITGHVPATPKAAARAPLAAASWRSTGVRHGQDPHSRQQKVR